jgi:predicted dehydrogenase
MATFSRIRIGVLGAATIVPMALTNPARTVPDAMVVAIAARDPKRATAFARKHQIPHVHDTYSDLLADREIDAIYNPLPNGLHAGWTIRALEAGKHVLCEKPFASNAREAQEMAKMAEERGLVLSEAFAYRYHPLTARIKEIMASGELGTLQHLDARFCFLLPQKGNIRFQYDLGGGALMDAGCYPASLIRHLAEAEPQVVSAQARLFSPQIDSAMTAHLSFADGRSARLSCDMRSPALFRSSVRALGDEGELSVINPYHPHWFHWMRVRGRNGSRFEHVRGGNVYALQLRAFIKAIRGEMKLNTDPADAIGNMRLIDAIYEKAGLNQRGT